MRSEQAARRFEQLADELDPATAEMDDTEDLRAVAAASEATRADEARLREAVESATPTEHFPFGGEDDKSSATVHGSGGRQDALVAGICGGGRHCLCSLVVVSDQVLEGQAKGCPHLPAGEIQYLQALDDYPADPTVDLERVDTLLGEVAKQLRPSRLLLVRGVPNTGPLSTVISAVRGGRISEGRHGEAGSSLVPERPCEPSSFQAVQGLVRSIGQT